MARKRKRTFAGTAAMHRGDASSFSKEARRHAQKAREAIRHGDCGRALTYFGLTAFTAGMAVGNRKWIGGKKGKLFRGGSKIGGRIHDLQLRVERSCRLTRR